MSETSTGLPSGLPYLRELLQGGQKISRRSSSVKRTNIQDTSTPVVTPITDGPKIGEGRIIKYGELIKTSRSRANNKIHGPPRRRRFRLTEDSIDYFQHFSQVKIRRSFPLTSVQNVLSVPANPAMFQLVFHSFIMELEAPNPFEAKAWLDALRECVSNWQDDSPGDEYYNKNVENEHMPHEDNLPLTENESLEELNVTQNKISTITQKEAVLQKQDSFSGFQKKSRRGRSWTTEGMLRRQSTEDDPYDKQHHNKKTIRKRLRLAPKLEKQKAIMKLSEDERLDFKKLHGDFAMIKYPRTHRWAIPSEKIFSLDKDNLQVVWKKTSASKVKLTSCLRLDSILEVRLGQQSLGFERFPYAEVDNQSFSLIYDSAKGKYARLESLDLVCDHPKHFNEWIKGLDSLQIGPISSMFPTRYENTDPTLIWLKRFWTLYHNNHELSEKDAQMLAQYFNPYFDSQRAKFFLTMAHNHQHEATLGYGNSLKWDGFVLLYNIMCGETGRLYNIYQSYAQTFKRLGLTLDEFKEFLQNECYCTNEECTYNKLKELIRFHDHHHRSFKKFTSSNKANDWKTSSHLLSFAGFLSFLRSKQNSCINPLHNTVYQDMTQPLSHYFINSSHNTYLEADQIKGRSSLDAYVRALLLGSRCIEIDCWDNNLGSEPIIYHGYTLTTKLPFSDVIRTIKEYSFRMSHFPLIISIENHCSSTQQARMAKIFVEELKGESGQSMLATENLVEERHFCRRRLPSPLELQGKILLKGSYRAQSAKVLTKGAANVASRAILAMKKTSLDLLGNPESSLKSPNIANRVPDTQSSESPINASKPNYYIFEPKGSFRREARSFRKHIRQHGECNVEVPEDDQELLYTETSDDLKELIIYCRSTSIKPWSWTEQKLTSICQMFSFSEVSLDKHCKKSSKELLNCTERQLVRTYPRGSRIDSSNYDPLPFWNNGIHMVALNYQTPDMFMHLNQGRFRQNGGCGYVLKPEIMRKANAGTRSQYFDVNMTKPHPLVSTCNFELELLSGQGLAPIGKRCNGITISVSLCGIPADSHDTIKADTDDPFWPQWAENQHEIQCQVLMPELCLLYIRVTNDTKSLGSAINLFGQNCIAFCSLCPGIKFIQLRRPSGELMPESGLFVRMKMEYENISEIELHGNDTATSYDHDVPVTLILEDTVEDTVANTFEVAAEVHFNT